MSFLKFQATQIFTGTALLNGSNVLICSDKGVVEEIVPCSDAGDDIQTFTGTLTPGFINCHCHLELSHMKAVIPRNTGLVNFVLSVVKHRLVEDETIQRAITQAEYEMMGNGVVAVGDICNTRHTIMQKLKRNLYYHNFIEAAGWAPTVANERLEFCKHLHSNFLTTAPSSIVPHAPYSVSNQLWQLLIPHFKDSIISIHNQESKQENELFIQRTGDFLRMYELMRLPTNSFVASGISSIQSYFQHMADAKNIILVHNTATASDDVQFVFKQRQQDTVFFCICINANLYINQTVPPIDMLIDNKAQLVIGTDSLASNDSLSIWDEVKTIIRHFPTVNICDALQWATLNGAKALDMQHTLGSFEKGKLPGIVLLENLDTTNTATVEDVTVRRLL